VIDVNEFDTVKIGLATAEQIQRWSNGEVKKPETINYRTLKPERDGLFCEKIFGPVKDWECACGKYKRTRFKGIICERCGVEVTRSKVRRERMGHIELAAPVAHIWYVKGVPSRLGYLLDMTSRDLEKVIYFSSFLVVTVDEEKRKKDLPQLQERLEAELEQIDIECDEQVEKELERLQWEIEELQEEGAREAEIEHRKKRAERAVEEIRNRAAEEKELLCEVFEVFKNLKPKQLIDREAVWKELQYRYSDYFTGGMGAKAVRDLIETIDLEEEALQLREIIETSVGQRRARAIKRLKVINAFLESGNDPRAMILTCIPVIPPDLRPMVQLDGGRFATSDLNDLYRRVINRSNRLKKLIDLKAPEIIVNNEKRMLQEAVDALFDNGRRGRPVTGPGNRPLKSLSDMLKGKSGRFRQNLLGKRVDYSGRSVIVVGPQLQLHQCGLPRQMALELFKPWVMKRLVDLELAQNVKSAKRMVERMKPHVWPILEEVIKEHPVLLNRAPTLHRLGIQAFEPVLVDGKAIQIHPLVCTAFNADFDGDQMAVHVPISPEAQAEARILMLSAHNILSPASGQPIVTPTQDMVIGLYYLTEDAENPDDVHPSVFASPQEVEFAYEQGRVGLHDAIRVRIPSRKLRGSTQDGSGTEEKSGSRKGQSQAASDKEKDSAGFEVVRTTVGRVIFNEALPDDFPFVNETVRKKQLASIVDDLAERYPKVVVARTLDGLKDLGFRHATKVGLTISMSDVKIPPSKAEILEEFENRAAKVEEDYQLGLISDTERREELIEIWTEATTKVSEATERELEAERFSPLYMMVGSGARGNIMQVRQLAGMRGLVANPRGEIIVRPIKSNYAEGLSVLEYFISTHGARKGLADTALRTADSGYLTRRLVDVAQEVIVLEEDCGTDRGIKIPTTTERPDMRIYGRIAAEDIKDPQTKKTLVKKGQMIGKAELEAILEAARIEEKGRQRIAKGLDSVTVRSVLSCETHQGVCQACYGMSLATRELVPIGEAVGIIAAQSIGEPGTQLTMRTFHTGGVAAEDITQGLPRVVELFEAREPKGKAIISEISGKVSISESEDRSVVVRVKGDGEERSYEVRRRDLLLVRHGQEIAAGTAITEGPKDPREILEVEGIRACQNYLVDEVQAVYRNQGVAIHDKHIEIIVRQMLRKVLIQDPGDSDFLPGDRVDAREFRAVNRELVAAKKKPAEGRPELMGITKASLATDSWLSAASFQETTRVLTEAAVSGKVDRLTGLKENVIIGKLIPAGTGMKRYRGVEVVAPDYVRPPLVELGEEALSEAADEEEASERIAEILAERAQKASAQEWAPEGEEEAGLDREAELAKEMAEAPGVSVETSLEEDVKEHLDIEPAESAGGD
jgi:DNA-directed RNA polymerase subunit beta'